MLSGIESIILKPIQESNIGGKDYLFVNDKLNRQECIRKKKVPWVMSNEKGFLNTDVLKYWISKAKWTRVNTGFSLGSGSQNM